MPPEKKKQRVARKQYVPESVRKGQHLYQNGFAWGDPIGDTEKSYRELGPSYLDVYPGEPEGLDSLIEETRARELNRSNQTLKDEMSETGSPLHAWEAYCLARSWNEPPPEWVLQYLDEVARVVDFYKKLADRGSPLPEIGSIAADALRFRTEARAGGRSVFTADHAKEQSQGLATRFIEQRIMIRDSNPNRLEKRHIAIQKVAERFGVSESTVRAAVKEWEGTDYWKMCEARYLLIRRRVLEDS